MSFICIVHFFSTIIFILASLPIAFQLHLLLRIFDLKNFFLTKSQINYWKVDDTNKLQLPIKDAGWKLKLIFVNFSRLSAGFFCFDPFLSIGIGSNAPILLYNQFFRAETVRRACISPVRAFYSLIFALAFTVFEISLKNWKIK